MVLPECFEDLAAVHSGLCGKAGEGEQLQGNQYYQRSFHIDGCVLIENHPTGMVTGRMKLMPYITPNPGFA